MFSLKFKIPMYESKWCIFLHRALVFEVRYFAKQFECSLSQAACRIQKTPAVWLCLMEFLCSLSFQEDGITNQYAFHWSISIYQMLDKQEDLILS